MDAKSDTSPVRPKPLALHAATRRIPPRLQRQSSGATGGESGLTLSMLEAVVAEVEQLTARLTVTQRQAALARQRAEETTSRLKDKVLRLGKLVEHVRQFAYHDELTGLPNRALLLDRLRQAMVRALREKKRVALLMIDLDGFKRVNDTYGHATGDLLLRHVASLLSSCIRGSDTACRYGGDEFVIMLPDVARVDSALAVVQKIRTHLATSFFVEGRLVPVTASIGMALYPGDGRNCDALLKHADTLMYREKIRSNALATAGRMNMPV